VENFSNNSNMILLADSGSTHTTWQVSDCTLLIKEVTTPGINPFFQTDDEINALILQLVVPVLSSYSIDAIYFYGAGCAFAEQKNLISSILKSHYPFATIEVESDLLGAARGLFQHEKGIACILGTGSNSCEYDGKNIVKNISPLGYILGDEGSGAVLGKLFIADCLKFQVPDWIREKFLDEYELSPSSILDQVYKQPFPNRFLASFTPFLLTHIDEPSIFNLVFDSFESFILRNIAHYNTTELPIGFIGSIALHFKDVLEIVCSEHQLEIALITDSPMEGLRNYHG
jgi:N-acetylglucosamine kinase-like BadF-type ATPase